MKLYDWECISIPHIWELITLHMCLFVCKVGAVFLSFLRPPWTLSEWISYFNQDNTFVLASLHWWQVRSAGSSAFHRWGEWDKFTWMYLWICHEACFPSFTDSTVVFAKPAISPPANTQGSLVCMVFVFTSGVPQRVSVTGAIAWITTDRKWIKLSMKTCHCMKGSWNISVTQKCKCWGRPEQFTAQHTLCNYAGNLF